MFTATTELTCGPRVRHRPAGRLRRAPTATLRCYRPTAAATWEQALEPEQGREPVPGPEPGPGPEQQSVPGPERAVGAEQEPEQPWAAGAERAYTGPWPQHHRPWPL